ncbi:MAG: ABC transporter permease [Acidimicrobiales bacterium]
MTHIPTGADPTDPNSAGHELGDGRGGTGDVHELTPARPLRSDVWRQFKKNRLAVAGLVFIVFLALVAIFASVIAPHDFAARPGSASGSFRQGPSSEFWFGTDAIGRDLFSRIVYGARVSLRIGVFATTIALTIGLVLGATAGFFGGIIETLIMRVTDIFLAIPYIVLAVAVAAVFGRSENAIILVLGLTGWLGVARIVRSSFLSLKQLEYVEAATALGFGRARIMFRHILPNALQPIIVYGTIAIGTTILAEAALSFLGVGPQDPTPAWGLMVSQGKGDLANAAHLVFFPGAAIGLTVLSFVLVGDGLRDALDPLLKGS